VPSGGAGAAAPAAGGAASAAPAAEEKKEEKVEEKVRCSIYMFSRRLLLPVSRKSRMTTWALVYLIDPMYICSPGMLDVSAIVYKPNSVIQPTMAVQCHASMRSAQIDATAFPLTSRNPQSWGDR
jgi:hypothetical protein